MQELTERQKEVYLFIVEFHDKHGYSPSIREIGSALYMSTPAVSRHLQNLFNKGYLIFTPKIARSIVINEKARAV